MGIGVRVVRSQHTITHFDAARMRKPTPLPRSPCALLQAGSLRSGSVSHLNKHGPAEDGGEFVEA